MNLNVLKNLYYNSPLWIKQVYSKIPYSVRNGKSYRDWNQFLMKEFSEEYPFIKLRETIHLAQNEIPYYKNVYAKFGMVALELKNLQDFSQLPFINKEKVQENYNILLNPTYKNRNCYYVTTGGSSGEPMKFIQSSNIWPKELAFTNVIFSKLSYKQTDLKASFRGAQFLKLPANTYWHHNPIQNEIQFSPFHLNCKTIVSYISMFKKKKPNYIHGYPSAILNFIRLAEAEGEQLLTPAKGVFLISENYSQSDVEVIKRFFKCPVLSFYGHSERLIIAPTIDDMCQIYEADQRYGFFELISNDGNKISSNEITGEITGTSFDNYAMPLIRYKTGDITSLLDSGSTKSIQFGPIKGRWINEYLEGKNGEQLTLTAINFHSNHFEGINSYQFFQEKPGFCELLLTSQHKISSVQIENILEIVNKKIGHALVLSIRQIESPLLTSRGKQLKLIKRI